MMRYKEQKFILPKSLDKLASFACRLDTGKIVFEGAYKDSEALPLSYLIEDGERFLADESLLESTDDAKLPARQALARLSSYYVGSEAAHSDDPLVDLARWLDHYRDFLLPAKKHEGVPEDEAAGVRALAQDFAIVASYFDSQRARCSNVLANLQAELSDPEKKQKSDMMFAELRAAREEELNAVYYKHHAYFVEHDISLDKLRDQLPRGMDSEGRMSGYSAAMRSYKDIATKFNNAARLTNMILDQAIAIASKTGPDKANDSPSLP